MSTAGPTRILHVSQPTTAGVALAVRQLAVHQKAHGLDVVVACPAGGTLGGELAEHGVPTVRWEATRSPGSSVATEVRNLRALLRAIDPDVVHLHSSKAGLVGRLAVRGARPTVFQPNAWSFLQPGRTQAAARAWERTAARWTDLFVLVSENEAEVGRDAGIHGPVCLVRNGVDPAALAFADGPEQGRQRQALGLGDGPIAVCVGRLCEQKGQLDLVERWADVRAALPGAELVLVGDGPERGAIEALARSGVMLAGEQRDVRPWLAAADLAVQPSRWEGQSFATIEALSVGRPVVAYDVEGMAEAIGACGETVPKGDGPALTAAVVGLLADDDRRTALGLLARKRVEEHFDAEIACAAVTKQTLATMVEREDGAGSIGSGVADPRASSAASSPRPLAEPGVPTFLLIGAARSGTTFLAHHLGRHDDITISDPKEPHFLAFGGEGDEFHGPGDETVVNRVAVVDERAWRSLFPGVTAAQGEGSVSTLYRPDRAIPKIRRQCPDARLIVVLRDPVDRAHSAWSYQVSRGFEDLSFADALDAEPERIEAGWQHLWHYVEMGRYSGQLRPFLEAFGRDRVLVIDYDDLSGDPVAVLDRCFTFLGVAPVQLDGLDQDINAGGQPRSQLVVRAMSVARSVEPLRKAVRAAVPFALRERIRGANLKTSVLDGDARDRLRDALDGERAALVALLGDDAPGWARR